MRAPDPGGVGGAYRAFGETLRGLKTTFARIVEGPTTIQYPEEKMPVYPRFRGRHKLHRFEDTGLEKCVGCSLCAAACPADCIRVVAAENTPENRVSAGERYAAVYEINMSPLHLLRLLRGRVPVRRDHDGPRLRAVRLQPRRPHLHQGDAARRAARAHAAAGRGRVGARLWPPSSSSSPRSAPSPAPSASSCSRNPFYSCSRWSCHLLALAALFLLLRAEFVAAAQVVVYAGAVMVLYVFVVAYVGGADEPLDCARAGAEGRRAAVRRCALFVELWIAVLGSGLEGARHRGRRATSRLRLAAARSARLLLTEFLLAFEVASILLLVAAVGAVMLARRRRGLGDEEGAPAISVSDMLGKRPQGTGTMAEGVGALARDTRRGQEGRGRRRGEPAAAGERVVNIELVPRRLGADLLASAPPAC